MGIRVFPDSKILKDPNEKMTQYSIFFKNGNFPRYYFFPTSKRSSLSNHLYLNKINLSTSTAILFQNEQPLKDRTSQQMKTHYTYKDILYIKLWQNN